MFVSYKDYVTFALAFEERQKVIKINKKYGVR